MLLDRVQLVGFDTENSGINAWGEEGTIWEHGFSIAILLPTGEYISEYFPVNHERGLNMPEKYWRPILEKVATKRVIIHNVKYDLKIVRRFYGVLFKKFIDTTKLSHLHNENWGMDHDGNVRRARTLENLCAEYKVPGKVESVEFKALLAAYGWERIGSDEVSEYAAADAVAVLRLYYAIVAAIEKNGELKEIQLYWKLFEEPNFRVLYRMKNLGIGVDMPKTKYWSLRAQVEMGGIEEELGFNPNSPKQLAPILYDELKLPVQLNKKTGNPTLNKDTMEYYEEIIEGRIESGDISGDYAQLASSVLEYRGWKKADSAYFSSYEKLADAHAILRPDYKSHGTVTGRYSCSEPNLQQIPKQSENVWNSHIKGLFLPVDEDSELWEFDYSQLEFRLGAHFSKEPKLLDVFNDGERDIFNEMASDLGLTRNQCKTLTYSINYGAGAQRIMDVFGYNKPKALATIDSFYQNYPLLRRANEHIKMMAERQGKVQLWSGRWRHIPNKRDARKAFNSYIQGGGADIVKHVMNRTMKEIPHIPLHLQVHDSLIFSLRKDQREEQKAEILHIMNHPTEDLGIHWDVDLKAEGEPIVRAA